MAAPSGIALSHGKCLISLEHCACAATRWGNVPLAASSI
jgi:hypothetical protein